MPDLPYVLFDLGDVVCHFRPARRLAALAATTHLHAEDIQQSLWDSGFSVACDAGCYTASAMHAQMCQRLGFTCTRHEAGRLWALAFEPNVDVLAIATDVRRHLPTGLLTNNPLLLHEALPHCLPEIERDFDPILFSYQYGACKPRARLYSAVGRHLGVSPAQLLLIDDARRNVQGAQAAGWHAIHFTGPEALRAALGRFGMG